MVLTIVIASIVAALIVYTIISNARWRKRMLAHVGLSREAFQDYFLKLGVDPKVSEAGYQVVLEKVGLRSFQPFPELSFDSDLDIVDEDVDEYFQAMLAALRLEESDLDLLGEWPGSPSKTIQDLILWADWVHRGLSKRLPACQQEGNEYVS